LYDVHSFAGLRVCQVRSSKLIEIADQLWLASCGREKSRDCRSPATKVVRLEQSTPLRAMPDHGLMKWPDLCSSCAALLKLALCALPHQINEASLFGLCFHAFYLLVRRKCEALDQRLKVLLRKCDEAFSEAGIIGARCRDNRIGRFHCVGTRKDD